MWIAFERRCERIGERVEREVHTQRTRYEHLSRDPDARASQVDALIADARNTDKIAADYLAAADRYARAATAYGVAVQVEQQRRIITLLERLVAKSTRESA
jgi:t-SNARE complex subunit (syntaxin)